MTNQITKFFSIALMALMLAACVSNPSAAVTADKAPEKLETTNTAVPATPANSYVVQPGDILEISVWKEKDLQREIMVRPDGGLNFPLAGDVIASGKSVEQLQKELTSKISKYVPDPVITIAVKQSLGNKIYVVGKVNKPGEFVAYRTMDVMQALSIAGGPTVFASVNKIKILRRVNGELRSIPFKYSRVEKGEDLEQNIVLQGGDVVVVP